MRRVLRTALLNCFVTLSALAAGLGVSGPAAADSVSIRLGTVSGHGHPHHSYRHHHRGGSSLNFYSGPRVYYVPPPVVYHTPPPVYYYPPAPVYIVPAPPPPVVYAPVPSGTIIQPSSLARRPPPCCREYRGNALVEGTNQPFHGRACLEADGLWHMVN